MDEMTVSYRVEFPDPYETAYERVMRDLRKRLQMREQEGIDDALRQHGYVKRKTCSRKVAHDAQTCSYCGWEPDFWPTRCEDTAWRFCPRCGAAVVDDD